MEHAITSLRLPIKIEGTRKLYAGCSCDKDRKKKLDIADLRLKIKDVVKMTRESQVFSPDELSFY